MKSFIRKIFFPLFASCLMVTFATSCSDSDSQAAEAFEQAEKGNMDKALEHASAAYENYQSLDLKDLCRLSATYAALALTNGDEELAHKFQVCYKASLHRDTAEAEAIYRSFDPQMADGLALINGLLDNTASYSDGGTSADEVENAVTTTAVSEN